MSIEALSFEQTNLVFGGDGTSADNPLYSTAPAGFIATGAFQCLNGQRSQFFFNPVTQEVICVAAGGCDGSHGPILEGGF